jgi:hypothetical protein
MFRVLDQVLPGASPCSDAGEWDAFAASMIDGELGDA